MLGYTQDSEKKPVGITPRQWATYRLVRERSLKGLSTPLSMIFSNYCAADHPEDGYVWTKTYTDNFGSKHWKEYKYQSETVCYRQVWSDINALKKSPELEKAIVFKHYNYELGSKDKIEKQRDEYKERAIKLLVRASILDKKIKADGQGKLISCQGKEITDDSQARRFVDSFIDGKVEITIEKPTQEQLEEGFKDGEE